MLKLLTRLQHQTGPMGRVVADLGQMIAIAQTLHRQAWEAFCGLVPCDAANESVRLHDQQVNALERRLRRKVAVHLAAEPAGDISGCLALMIMVRDLERLGDEAKNICGLAAEINGNGSHLAHFADLERFYRGTAALFPILHDSIAKADGALAQQVIEQSRLLKPLPRAIRAALLDAQLPTREAVVTALATQHFKRINAHLRNVASGLVFPLENVDYVSRGLRTSRHHLARRNSPPLP